jgi:hypothetical protein
MFGQALYDVVYPKWWGGQGKASEEPVTAKVNEQVFRHGSNAIGAEAVPQWQRSYGASLEVTVPKGPRPKERVDVTKMVPAGMHSSYKPRTGGPKKRGDPYNLDESGNFAGAGKAINLNLLNDQFIPPPLSEGMGAHLRDSINYPIIVDRDNAKSRIKALVDEDKYEKRRKNKEREGYSEDEERENSQGEVNEGNYRIPDSKISGSKASNRNNFLEDEVKRSKNMVIEGNIAHPESDVPITSGAEEREMKNSPAKKKRAKPRLEENQLTGGAEDDMNPSPVAKDASRGKVRATNPGRTNKKPSGGYRSDDEPLNSPPGETLNDGVAPKEREMGIGKTKSGTRDQPLDRASRIDSTGRPLNYQEHGAHPEGGSFENGNLTRMAKLFDSGRIEYEKEPSKGKNLESRSRDGQSRLIRQGSDGAGRPKTPTELRQNDNHSKGEGSYGEHNRPMHLNERPRYNFEGPNDRNPDRDSLEDLSNNKDNQFNPSRGEVRRNSNAKDGGYKRDNAYPNDNADGIENRNRPGNYYNPRNDIAGSPQFGLNKAQDQSCKFR